MEIAEMTNELAYETALLVFQESLLLCPHEPHCLIIAHQYENLFSGP